MLRYLPGAPVKSFALIIVLFALQVYTGKAWGQTDPAAQALPYSQNFSVLTGSTTTYPAGFQGWVVPGALTTTVLTAAPSGNVPLFAGQTNASTSPFVGDMWGKIGMLSGATVNALCLALNTTTVTSGNVQLIYTAATQGQTAAGYVDELDLQYRIGTSGAFTTIAGATYRNNALTNTNTPVTTAYNPATVYVVLPAACTNQPVVELRWISRNVTGSSAVHPGFSISNVIAQQNVTTEYYSKATGNLDNVATWGINADGTGAAPANFTADAQVFHISNGNAGTLGANWTVSGAGSKVIVDATDFTNTATNTVTATIDVNAGRTLTLQNGTLPTLGSLNAYSTVVFSNLTGVAIPTVTPSYGSITFSNSTVSLPGATQKVMFAGNFTLQGTTPFVGANSGLGYSLVSYGNNAQVINANGLPLTIWNLDVGSTNGKIAGPLSLAANTNITAENSVVMVLNGTTPLYTDNAGDTINVINNFDCGGASTAYNFLGTVSLNSAGSGSCNIRGSGSSLNPCVAAVNNLVLNNNINVKVNPSSGGITFVVKGDLSMASTSLGVFNFQNNTVSVGGNFNYNNTNNGIFTMGTGTLVFNGTGAQSYTSIVPGGNTLSNMTMANTGSGLTLNAPLNVSGTTTLTSGIVATGVYSLSIGAAGNVTGASSTSYVNGNLTKAMPAAGSTSMFYDIGDANSYAPILLTFSSSMNSGNVTAKATAGAHPSMATSYVNPVNFVNRYWTISAASVNPATVNAAFSYNSADITSGLGLNTGFIIREYTSGAWTTSPSETNTTSATAPLLPFASTTTGVNGSTFSGDYVAGAFDCTLSPGTATGSPAIICGSGTSTLSLAGATTNSGNTYQWQSSPDGSSWTNITGATAATYSPSVIATTTYYRNNVGCIPTATTVNSAPAVVSVNPLPAAISGAVSGCIGATVTLSDATGAGTWSSSNTVAATIGSSSGIYTGLTPGTSTITYTAAATGCTATATLTINPAPLTPVVSPLLISLCPGSPAQLVSASGDTLTSTFTVSSGALSIPIPYNNGVSSSIAVSSIPAGAIVTNVSVTFSDSNSSASEGRDFVYNLEAPNGNIINLINATGGSATNDHFRNISVGSAGTVMQGLTPLVPGVMYIASLINGIPSTAGFAPSGLISNSTAWSSLYSTPNGNWTFIADNIYSGGAGEGTLADWILNITYIVPPSVTWSPTTGLYTDAGASTAYTGTNTNSVYAKPSVTTTYNVTASIGACTASTSVVAQSNATLYVPSISGPSVLCFGSTITMTDSTTGGTWSSSGAASIGSSSGLVTGSAIGTATITYTYTSGPCSVSTNRVISVNALPSVSAISGAANMCYSGTPVAITLSDATTGGTWSSSNVAVATINGSTGAVSGIATGSSIITYTYSDGTCAASVNATLNVFDQPSALTVSPTSVYVCGGTAPQMFTASGGLIPGSATAASGPISVLCTTITPTPATLAISGVPAGATVTGIAVTFNVNCSYDGDAELNLAAPNGSVINLFASGTGNSGVNFVNTTISSAGVTAIPNSASGAPWTGTYAANARTNAALTRPFSTYSVTTTTWAPLEAGSPNGTWSLVGLDDFRDSTFTITSWSIAISYNYQSSVTWANVGGLYTNSGGTVAYTGTVTDTVYSAPASTTIYTVSATNGTCSSTANATMSINPAPAAISGNLGVCFGSNTQLTDAGGGTWSTTSGNITIGSSNGLVTSVALGTAIVTYTSTTGCSVTAVVTVNNMPGGISGTLTVCQGRSTSLADGGGGTWASGSPGNATVGSTGLVTGVTGGTTATITYTLAGGCYVTAVVTVNIAPSAITGTRTVCIGSTTCLSDGVSGGTWSSNNGNVLVGSTGCITGAVSGTSIITYKLTSTGCIATAITTANAAPGNITGVLATCQGTNTQLTDAGVGTWSSSNTAVATVGTGNGLVNGVAGGTSTIGFTIADGCSAITTVSINPLPGSINGSPSLCLGFTTQLTDANASGTWASSNGNVTIGSAGGATGVTAGTAIITYTLPTSCATTIVVTVNPNPGNINGALAVCQGATTQLTDADGGGTWISSDAGNATISGTGVVAGITGNTTTTITYTLPTTCSSTAVVTVSPSPGAVNGTLSVCQGLMTQLSDVFEGGTWSSSNGNATVSSTGAVTGSSAGTATISYILSGGCFATATVTVNSNPGAISGILTVCESTSTQLTDAGGGTWASSNAGNASVSGGGLVSGLTGNTTTTITYTLPTTCSVTTVVTVNPSPAIINGTMSLCQGATTQLTNAVPGGTWSSSNGNATAGSAGLVAGVSAGTATISYLLAGGCTATAVVTVNGTPGAINGTLSVCEGLNTQLTDAGTGTWASSNAGNASITGSGLVTGNAGGTTATITYTLLTGCSTTAVVTVNVLPSAISGTLVVCQGLTTQLSDAGGGTWNTASINASVDGSGVVTGINGGTTANITYTLSTGCTTSAIVTINALPAPISGAGAVCAGSSITLSDAGGGSWSGSNASATVDGSGDVTGLSSGTMVVTYMLSTGCEATKTIVVNTTPGPISGADSVCVGLTTSLSDDGTGTWSSNNGNVSVDASGLVSGINAGTSVITYTLPAGGCYATAVVTVNALPSSILGTASVSVGFTTTLSDAGGGSWSISNGNATIDAAGLVTGVTAGTSIVTYTLETGCSITTTLTIVATLPAITGDLNVCAGSVTALNDAGTGTWSSSNGNVTVGSATGHVTGVNAGTSVITFSFAGGGEVYATVTVNPLPSSITGLVMVCQGAVITLSDGTPGGSWSSGVNAGIGTSGIVTGLTPGTATISYTISSTLCAVGTVITINALPSLISGAESVCVGATTGLSDATTGGTWSSSNTNASIGTSGVVTGAAPGSATITYTSALGCSTIFGIVIDPPPGAISGTASVCQGLTTSLSDAGEGTWSSSNANATINEISGLVTGASAGTSIITYMLSTGCTATAVVTVNAMVVPSIIIADAAGTTVCSGSTILFTTTITNGGTAPTYQWSVNASAITGATNSSFSYAPSNTDVVSATVTSNAACAVPATATDAKTMTVVLTDTSSVHISVAPGDTVCRGSYALFAASAVNGGASPVYLWSVNSAQVGTGPAYGYVPNTGDNIYCKLVSSLQCVASDTVGSNHIVMQVDTSYVPIVEVFATPGVVIGPFAADTFRAVVTNAGPVVNYQWFINTTPIAGATNDLFTASGFSNNDSVSCAVVSAGPCGYASFNSVIIKIIYTGVPQVGAGQSNVRLIPNPNKGQFVIKGSLAVKNEDVTVEITDMLGQVVYKNTTRANGGDMDEAVSLKGDMPNGMYLLNLRSGNENVVLHFVIGQ